AQQQRPQTVCSRTAIRDITCASDSIHAGDARLIPRHVTVDEEKPTVIECRVGLAVRVAEILATLNKHVGVSKGRVARATSAGRHVINRKGSGGATGLVNSRNGPASRGTQGRLLGVPPATKLRVRAMPAKFLGELLLAQIV